MTKPVDYRSEEWARISGDPIQLEEDWNIDLEDLDDYRPGHITPVGGWIAISLVILVVLVAVAWRITRG